MKIIEADYLSEDGIPYHSYGLEMDGVRVEDISPDRAAVEEICIRLQDTDALPEQIWEIIEDFLCE